MVNKSQNQSKEVQTREIQGPIEISEDLITSMEKTITDCLPATSTASQTIKDSLVIANGLNSLRTFFQNEDVKKLINTMRGSALGFLTDKEAGKKWNGKKQKMVDVVPYTYDEVVEALIPPMLEGYRFTGNEINIISGKGMPVKAGKHRKINELTKGFKHSIGGPVKDGSVAKMKCQASWSYNDENHTIGYGDDICIIHVKTDDFSGIDKLIGLAESKLFSRVLTRVSGKLVIEGDVHEPENKDITPDDKPKATNIMNTESKPEKKPEVKPAEKKPEDPKKVTFVEKLGTVVDDKDYAPIIQELLKEGKIKTPSATENDLRTKDEYLAKLMFELIEDRKDLHDSAAKDQ
jgi:hypothetical protein